jgi:hypothetical protein
MKHLKTFNKFSSNDRINEEFKWKTIKNLLLTAALSAGMLTPGSTQTLQQRLDTGTKIESIQDIKLKKGDKEKVYVAIHCLNGAVSFDFQDSGMKDYFDQAKEYLVLKFKQVSGEKFTNEDIKGHFGDKFDYTVKLAEHALEIAKSIKKDDTGGGEKEFNRIWNDLQHEDYVTSSK